MKIILQNYKNILRTKVTNIDKLKQNIQARVKTQLN